jgi:hypothetical protein
MNFLFFLLSAGFIGFVMWPAFRGTRVIWEYSDEDTPLGRLDARKEVLVGNLADLDFDFAMGKVGEDDYMSLRNSLKRQTLNIMEQIEVIAGGKPVSAKPTAAQATAAHSTNCSSCGGTAPREARFCPNCGTLLGG